MTKKEQTQDKEEQNFWANLWRESLVAMSLGWDMAIPIFGGVLIGYLLDRWLGTRHIFTLGLLVMGIAIGYYNLGSFISRLNKHDKARKRRKQDEGDKEQ
jgi:ATP synthase protein I